MTTTTTTFVDLLDACDAVHAAPGFDKAPAKAVWNALKKDTTFAPLKPLLTFQFGIPRREKLLLTAVESGGALKQLADDILRNTPHEIWVADGAKATRNTEVHALHKSNNNALAIFSSGKDKFEVIDLASDDFAVRWAFKLPARSHAMRFDGDGDAIHALLEDGRVIKLKRGDRKPTVVAELGEVTDGALSDRHVAAIRKRVVLEGPDEGTELFEVVIDGVVHALNGVRVVSVSILGDHVFVHVTNAARDGGFVTIHGGTITYTWLPRRESSGSEPPSAVHAHRFESINGESFVITSVWGLGTLRWRRLPDLVEDPRFGDRFELSDVHGDTMWSRDGQRLRNGTLTDPLYAGNVWRVIALADDSVVTSGVDSKDKGWLRRWKRYTPG